MLIALAVAGWLAGRAVRLGEEHGATAHGPMLLFTLVLAFAVLGASGVLHVDGILAVFVAGLAFNVSGSGTDRTSALFYLTLEAKEMSLPTEVLSAGTLVVVATTVAHGLTGSPGRVLFRRANAGGAQPQPAPARDQRL